MISTYIDLAIVALIVLGAVIGLFRGFFKTLLSFFGTIVSIIISAYLASWLAGMLLPVSFVNGIFGETGSVTTGISQAVTNVSPDIFGVPLAQLPGTLTAALTETLHLPAAIADIIVNAVNGLELAKTDLTLGAIIGQALSSAILWLVCAVLLFIVLRIVLAILKRIFKRLTKNKHVRKVDRLLGFLLGAVKGAVGVAVVFVLMSFVIGMQFMGSFKENLEGTTIGKPVSDVIFKWTGETINLEGLLKKAFQDKIDGIKDGISLASPNAKSVLDKLNESGTDTRTADDFNAITLSSAEMPISLGSLYSGNLNLHAGVTGALQMGLGNGFIDGDYETAMAAAEAVKQAYADLFAKYDEYIALSQTETDAEGQNTEETEEQGAEGQNTEETEEQGTEGQNTEEAEEQGAAIDTSALSAMEKQIALDTMVGDMVNLMGAIGSAYGYFQPILNLG
ncbi:MAG: CvpA family protein [Clostridiales bacterium]|jgi:uncharacterized membrane protein required for colicin V production|nr:CvpA family protein [Clostridiales bacterium]